MRCSDAVGASKIVNDCYALRSLPEPAADGGEGEGGERGRQPAHSDAPDAPDGSSVGELADDDVPLSVRLGVEPGTRLWIWPHGCDTEPAASAAEARAPFALELEVGEMLVWRGDLVHAGASYDRDHVRVHAYVDPPAHVYERPRGKTNRCSPQ